MHLCDILSLFMKEIAWDINFIYKDIILAKIKYKLISTVELFQCFYLLIFFIFRFPQLMNVTISPSEMTSASAPSMYTRGPYQTVLLPTSVFWNG